jgi:predicted ATPase with chaperone activity
LESKANKFKPKLDKMQESVVVQKLAKQEQMKRQQQAASEAYMQNVYNTVAAADLNGIKLDKRTQNMIYTGLVQPSYPSISGKQTNLLGHLLEKYQYVEPDYNKIAKVLWLLADEEGYESKVKEQGKAAQVEKTVRQLKTEQAKMATSTPVVEKEETTQRRIPRNGNFFKR